MNIPNLIKTFGKEAVEFYAHSGAFQNECQIPETFISGYIARRFYEQEKIVSIAEQSFWQTAVDLGNEEAIQLAETHWNGKADITLYRNGKPFALIEIKKHHEGSRVESVVSDKEKLKKFNVVAGLKGYIGVLVTDTWDGRKATLSDERFERLRRALGDGCPQTSGPINSKNEDWKWQFIAWGPFTLVEQS